MKEKSSEPMLGSASRSTIVSPTRPAAASAMTVVWAGSLTSALNRTRQSTLALAPRPAATCSTVRRNRASIFGMVLGCSHRAVPPKVAEPGMTL